MMADGDGRALGDDLGGFTVDADLAESSCGTDALDSPEQWTFDIRLSQEGSELFWNAGAAAVTGTVADDGEAFSFRSETRVEVTPANHASSGCTVLRADRASGKLASSQGAVNGFRGTLVYEFAEDEGSDCSELLGVPSGFATLPCEMRYSMKAIRTAEPDEKR